MCLFCFSVSCDVRFPITLFPSFHTVVMTSVFIFFTAFTQQLKSPNFTNKIKSLFFPIQILLYRFLFFSCVSFPCFHSRFPPFLLQVFRSGCPISTSAAATAGRTATTSAPSSAERSPASSTPRPTDPTVATTTAAAAAEAESRSSTRLIYSGRVRGIINQRPVGL